MAERYCTNCGQELTDDSRFCPSCGRPVHETAQVPTPEADVNVPPPPEQTAGTGAPQTAAAPQAAPQQRRGWGSRILIGCLGLIGVFIVLIVGVALLAGGGGDQEAASPEAELRDQETEFMNGQAPPPEGIRECAVGQPCEMGESTLTVTDVRMDDIVPITFDRPLTNGPFVFVEYEYTYGGDEVVSISDYPRWPLNAGDRRYVPDFDATSSWSIENDEDITLEDMQPGVPIAGHLVYRIAADSQDAEFTLGVEDLIAPNRSNPAAIPVLR